MKPSAALSRLPPASEAAFPGLFAWSPVSTSVLTAALNLDRGLWGTWRNRRLTPAPLPATWFRAAPGAPLVYRVDHVLTWLAARRGERFDTEAAYRDCLASLGLPPDLVWVRRLAERDGPRPPLVVWRSRRPGSGTTSTPSHSKAHRFQISDHQLAAAFISAPGTTHVPTAEPEPETRVVGAVLYGRTLPDLELVPVPARGRRTRNPGGRQLDLFSAAP